MYSYPTRILRPLVAQLAYCFHHTVRLNRGNHLPISDLRILAQRCGFQNVKQYRYLRDLPLLATTLTSLVAADLLCVDGNHLQSTHRCQAWLKQSAYHQLSSIVIALENQGKAEASASVLNCAEAVSIDTLAWLNQQIEQQMRQMSEKGRPIEIVDCNTQHIRFLLPRTVDADIEFKLLGIAEIVAPDCLQITPTSLAASLSSGANLTTITYTLESALHTRLPPTLRSTLDDWYDDLTRYSLEPSYLLTARHPNDLQALLTSKRLKRTITKQLSSRHATVDGRFAQRFVRSSGIQLVKNSTPTPTSGEAEIAEQWLGLRMLRALNGWIDLPIEPAISTLDALASQLPDASVSALEGHAQTMLAQLQRVIAGADAFQPPHDDLSPSLLDELNRLLEAGESVEISYQSNNADYPSTRIVDPIHLEERGSLWYLIAYCHRSEAERTFRLDRIHALTRLPHPTTEQSVGEIDSNNLEYADAF